MRHEGVNAGVSRLKDNDIDALVIIGGDGSSGELTSFMKERDHGRHTGTIDNDMAGTDCTKALISLQYSA
jgi:6-phosphofructokinase 1